MTHHLTHIDHVVVGVRDLDAAAKVYSRLGFTLTPRGRHIGWGTANLCAMFERDYIELLGIVDPSRFVNNLDRFLESREGPMAVALGTDDAAAAAASLTAATYAAEGPKELARVVTLPDGESTPRFNIVLLPPEATPGINAFVCQHLTPELMRRKEWLVHANGARAIHSVTAVVEDPRAVADDYSKLFGPSAVTLTDNSFAVRIARNSAMLLLARADDLSALHPAVEPVPYEPPYIAAITMKVFDVAATAEFLRRQGLAFVTDPDGALRLPASAALGSILEFRA